MGVRAVRLQPQGDRLDATSTTDLASQYDTIVLPDGTSRATIVNGLSPERNDKEWAWAYGVGDAGWKKLGDWVRGGGTLVAIGSAVETARQLLDLPIEASLPEPRAGGRPAVAAAEAAAAEAPRRSRARSDDPNRALRDAFSSPASLDAMLRERVIDPTTLFYCPGSLLQNEFNTAHPVAFGMPASWPVFFEGDQAYRLKPGFTIQSEVVSRYPTQGPILQSGWLLGEDLLRDQANVVAFRVGKGYVVTLGSQVDFRAQPRATFKLLFNAMFHGPSTKCQMSNGECRAQSVLQHSDRCGAPAIGRTFRSEIPSPQAGKASLRRSVGRRPGSHGGR